MKGCVPIDQTAREILHVRLVQVGLHEMSRGTKRRLGNSLSTYPRPARFLTPYFAISKHAVIVMKTSALWEKSVVRLQSFIEHCEYMLSFSSLFA